jgi:hypothetical protein
LIRQYADVGPRAGEQIREHHAVQNAEGMVRDRDDRSVARNLFEIGFPHVDMNLKIVQQPPHEALFRARARIQIFEAIDLQEMIDSVRQRPRQAVGRKCFECHSSAYGRRLTVR